MRPIAFIAAIVIATPALAQSAPVNGFNVQSATHSAGSFRQGAGKNWGEYDNAGNRTFSFVEEMRDEWSVYLFDPARGVKVQIDLYRKKIRVANAGQPYADFYDVSGATAGMAPPQPRPGPSGMKSYDVGAGPIWDQRDAERKCPAIAWSVKGTWTGEWSTIVNGSYSVCRIRF